MASLAGWPLCAEAADAGPFDFPGTPQAEPGPTPAGNDPTKGDLFHATWPVWLVTPIPAPSEGIFAPKSAPSFESDTRPSAQPTPIVAIPDRAGAPPGRTPRAKRPSPSPAPVAATPERKAAPSAVASPARPQSQPPTPAAPVALRQPTPRAAVSAERQLAERVFKNFDTDGDGFISLAEFQEGMSAKMSPSRAAKVFKEKDRNGDGKLTLDELLHVPAEETAARPPHAKDVPTDNATKAEKEAIEPPVVSGHRWLYPIAIVAIGYLVFHVVVVVREKS